MTCRVPRKFVGRAMADSMSSSVDDDDNSLDGRNNVHSDRRQSLDYATVYHSPTVPKSEEKPRRRSNARPGYATADLMNHFNGSDPVRMELSRLENEVRGKAPQLFWSDDGLDRGIRSCGRGLVRSFFVGKM